MASGTTAKLPVLGYPAPAIFGAAPIAPGSNGPSSVNPVDNKQVLIVAAAIIALGYIVFHLNER